MTCVKELGSIIIGIANVIAQVNPTLSAAQPMASLGIVLHAEEGKALASLRVSDTKAYDNYGALERFKTDLQRFFTEQDNTDAAALAAASCVFRFVKACLEGLNEEAAWITVRASKPHPHFDIPRWHADGMYYESGKQEPRKIVVTWKGAGTLFNHLPTEERAVWKKLYFDHQESPDQQKIVAAGVSTKNVTQARLHEAFLYITASREAAALHSEPPIHEDRIFMSIVPGTAAQIAELRKDRGERMMTYSPE